MGKIKEIDIARKEAHKRLRVLEAERRQQIVEAIGKAQADAVVIQGHGGLTARGVDGKTFEKIYKALKKAGVNAAPQWKPLPLKSFANVKTFDEAGRPIGDSIAILQ